LQAKQKGELPKVNSIVVTVTGHGLKDPDWALRNEQGRQIKPKRVSATADSVAGVLGLEKNK
jgi:threonine synthase